MKKRIVVQGLPDYIRKITTLKPRKTESPLTGYGIVFRGLSDASFKLTPSIGRTVSPYWMNTIQTKETEQINQAQLKFPELFQNSDWPAINLAKLQHYGIPTRMMDVTSNALVGLYFACQSDAKNPDADGEVVAFSGYIYSGFNPFINAIADTARLEGNTIQDYNNFYYKITRQPYFSGEIAPDNELERRAEIFRSVTTRPLIVDVGDISTRQINQQGKFIIFPNKPHYFSHDLRWKTYEELVKLEKNDRMVIKEIIVPHSIKQKVLKDLERVGITEQYLFADNVDLVCRRIVEKQKELYYKDR